MATSSETMPVYPIIAIPSSRITDPTNGIKRIAVIEEYVRAIIQAGGVPIIIPVGMPHDLILEILNGTHGVLFIGGGDVNPSLYHGTAHPSVYAIDDERDRMEIFVYQVLIRRRTPFLAICRGMQIITVASGGSLYSDIADQMAGAIRHDCSDELPRDHLAHPVTVERHSLLSRIWEGNSYPVNSLHHQGIRECPPSLRPIAYAPDGLIEVIEQVNHPFGLAVQWHPEWLHAHAPMRALFAAFIDSCRI